jgi:hypothetical protein
MVVIWALIYTLESTKARVKGKCQDRELGRAYPLSPPTTTPSTKIVAKSWNAACGIVDLIFNFRCADCVAGEEICGKVVVGRDGKGVALMRTASSDSGIQSRGKRMRCNCDIDAGDIWCCRSSKSAVGSESKQRKRRWAWHDLQQAKSVDTRQMNFSIVLQECQQNTHGGGRNVFMKPTPKGWTDRALQRVFCVESRKQDNLTDGCATWAKPSPPPPRQNLLSVITPCEMKSQNSLRIPPGLPPKRSYRSRR